MVLDSNVEQGSLQRPVRNAAVRSSGGCMCGRSTSITIEYVLFQDFPIFPDYILFCRFSCFFL